MMSAVQLREELNDSTISSSQGHEATKKHKKCKDKTHGDDQPADDIFMNTTVDGLMSEEKRKHKKKKRDRTLSENNDSIIEPSQSDTVEVKSKRHKSKSKEKPVKEPEIEENQEPESDAAIEAKRKEKKKRRDRSSVNNNDSVIEPSQSNVVEKRRKRHRSQTEEELPNVSDIEPEQDKDSTVELTQESRRKRRKINHVGDVSEEAEKEPESSEEGNTCDNRLDEDGVDVNDNSDDGIFSLETADVICGSENGDIEEKDNIICSSEEGEIEDEVDKEHCLEDPNDVKSGGSVSPPGESVSPPGESVSPPGESVSPPGESVSPPGESCEESNAVNKNQIPSDEVDFVAARKKRSRPDRRKFISTNEKLSLPKPEEVNGLEEGEKPILRRSNRRSIAQNAEMSEEDEKMLLSRMLDFLPERDVVSYVFRLETFEWNNVRFGHFSAKQCQEQFHRIMTKIRKSRTLAELIHDAQVSRKKTTAAPKAKPIAKRTALQLYLKKKVDAYLQKHPGKSKREDATEKYRSKWAALSDEEKVKYVRKAEDHNMKFQEEVEEKCRNDPTYVPPKRLTTLSKVDQKILDKVDGIPPKPPSSGYMVFCEIMKERLKAEIPDISTQDLLAETGRRWSSLSEEKKEHYKRKSEKKKHKYLEFLEAHPEIEAKVNAEKRTKIVVKKTVKRIFDGEPAKPPSSGYMLFCKEIIPTLKDVPSRERMLEVSNRWGVLAEEKKTEYNNKVKAAMKIYLTELEAFKEKLSAEDLQQYEEINKKAPPKSPKKSSSSPSKEIAGKQINRPSAVSKEVVRKRKKTSGKKANKKTDPMVVKLWSKSPIPRTGRTGDDIDKGAISDSASEVF